MQGLARNTPSCAFSVSEASEYEEVPPQSQRQAGVCMCAPQARARVAVRHLPRRGADGLLRGLWAAAGGSRSQVRRHWLHSARYAHGSLQPRVAQSSVFMPCAMKPMTETCKRLGHGRAACRRGRLCADQEGGCRARALSRLRVKPCWCQQRCGSVTTAVEVHGEGGAAFLFLPGGSPWVCPSWRRARGPCSWRRASRWEWDRACCRRSSHSRSHTRWRTRNTPGSGSSQRRIYN